MLPAITRQPGFLWFVVKNSCVERLFVCTSASSLIMISSHWCVPPSRSRKTLALCLPQLRAAVGGRAVVGHLQLAPARPVLRQKEIVRHGWSPRLLSPHQRALGVCKGFQARLDKVEAWQAQRAEESIRNMADACNPRTGFGSIAQTLQQAQVRNSSISRGEVKSGRRPQLRASGAHEPVRWTWPT